MVEKLSLPSPERVVASVNAFKGPRSLMEKIPFLMPESTTPNKYVLAMNPLGTKNIKLHLPLKVLFLKLLLGQEMAI